MWKDIGVKYKISIREPTWAKWSQLWEEFDSVSEAEEFIRDVSYTYPEGTLLYITGNWNPTKTTPTGMFTRKAFMVDKYGQLRSRPRRWIPEGSVPLDWVREEYRPTEPPPEKPDVEEPEYVPDPIEELRGEDTEARHDRLHRILVSIDPEGFARAKKERQRYLDMERLVKDKRIQHRKEMTDWKARVVKTKDLPSDWSRFEE